MTAYILECFPYNPATSSTTLVAFANGLPDEAYLGRTQPYPLRLYDDFTMETSVFDGNVPSSTSISLGNISINNADGLLDYLLNYAWGGTQVTIKAGPDRGLYADFLPIFTGSALEITANAKSLTIVLRDAGWKLIEPLQKNKYTGGGFSDGYSDLAGVQKPLCYGLCKNIAPVAVDTVLLYYQIHDGAISAVSGVYDDGEPLTFYNNYANKAGLAAATIPEGSYASCLTEGLIRLGAPTAGVLTADVRGQYYDQVNLAQTIYQILLNKVGLTIGEMDAASFTALGTDMPYRVSGIYYAAPDLQIDQFLDAMMGMADSFWYIGSDGKLRVRRFQFGTPVAGVRAEDIQGLERLASAKPVYKVSVNYDRNLTIQDTSTVTLMEGDLNFAFSNDKLYAVNPSYGVTAKMLVYLGETLVNDLSILTFTKNTDVSWASISSDGTITITDPGGANGALSEVGFQAYYEDRRVNGTVQVEKRTDGKYLNLAADARVLKMLPSGLPKNAGQVITITRAVSGLAGPFTWSAVDNLGQVVTLGGPDTAKTLAVVSVQGNRNVTHVLVTCTGNSFTNTIRIPVSYSENSVAAGLIAADTYDDGTPKEALKPAQVGANVTALNTALGIFGQGILATRNNVDLATNEVLNKSLANLDPTAAAALSGAVAAIGSYASDDILSKGEKPAHNREWQRAYRSTTPYTTQATALGITTELTALNNKRTLLSNYLTGLTPAFDDVNYDTIVDGDTLYTLWTDFLTAEAVLLGKMSEEASKRASWSGVTGVGRPYDYADVTGSNVAAGITGQGTGATANNLQDLNPTDANNLATVMARISAMSSDDVMSKDEKWSFIESYRQYGTLYNSAATASNNLNTDFGGDPTSTQRNAATSAYNALTAYLNGLTPGWQDLTTDTPINGANLRTLFQNVSNTVATLMAANSREGSKRAMSDGMIYDQTTGSFLSRSQLITNLGIAASITGQGPGATGTADQVLNNSTNGNLVRVARPVGGTLENQVSSVTGAIKIKLPLLKTAATMLRFYVDIYEYSTGKLQTYEIGGHCDSTAWYSVSANLVGSSVGARAVRFGRDGTNHIIWIGEIAGTWSYPSVTIRDVQVSYSSLTLSTWETGWTLSFVTSFDTVQNTVSNPVAGDSVFGINTYEMWGGTPATLTNFKTSSGTAAGIAGQGPGATATGDQVLNNSTVNGLVQISRPVGGSYNNSSPGAVGAIKITLPQSWTATMMRFCVDIYDYANNETVTYFIAGYTYDGANSWYSISAQMIGADSNRRAVRFGHDGTKCCIWIGETNSTWDYPKVLVRDFQAGHGSYATEAAWATGWSVTQTTSAATNVSGAVDSPNSGEGVFGKNMLEGSGGSIATLPNFKTSSGTAAAITGQGPGATASGYQVLNNLTENSILRIAKPVGGAFGNQIPNAPGAIRIMLPLDRYTGNTMVRFFVDIYEYSTGNMQTYEIGGHFSFGLWYQVTANLVGSSTGARPVKFGVGPTNATVMIGEMAGVWQYPSIQVRDVVVSYAQVSESQWATNWAVSLETNPATFNIQITISNPTSGDAVFGVNAKETWGGSVATLPNFKTSSGTAAGFAGQGALATQNSVAYGSGYLTGFGTFAALSLINSGNISSYIANQAIGTAVIANAAIGTAQVDVINVSKISAGSLSALSANIGLLRTATSGARTEIESNQIRVYDSAGTMRVRMGVW